MTLAAQGKAFPRPRKAYLRRCRRLGSDCLLGCRLLLLAAALTAGHHQRQRACSRANRGLSSSRWRLEGEGTSTAATHASRMASVRRGTLHGRHCCCFRLRRQAGAGRFLCSPPRTRRGHLWFAGPSYMRSMWNASEISGLEKDPAMPTTSASVLLCSSNSRWTKH